MLKVKISWYHLLYADTISFFAKGENIIKSKNIIKIANFELENHHITYLMNNLMSFNGIFGKNMTYFV